MLRFLQRLFRKRVPEPDLSLWPYPLRDGDIERLVHHAIKVSRIAMPQSEWDLTAIFCAARDTGHGEFWKVEPQMLPDDLEAFGIDRRAKVPAEAFLCLTPEAQRKALASLSTALQFTIPAIGNRRTMNRIVQEIGPRQIVYLIVCDETGCAQARANTAETWASTAPDLPLPGCTSFKCLCHHRSVIEF